MNVKVRSVTRAAAGIVVASAVVVATPIPASAHYTYVYQGSDFMSVNSSHTMASVCDRENDNHLVYGQVINNYGQISSIWDTYDGICRTGGVVNPTSFRLCEELAGADACTGWRPA